MLPPQQSAAIEVTVRDPRQFGSRIVRQRQANFKALAVLERQRRPGPRVALPQHRRAMLLAQPRQQALDMLAGAQRVAGEVGA